MSIFNKNMHSTQKLLISLIITAVIFAAFGYFGAALTCDFSTPDSGSGKKAAEPGEDTFQAGWEAARQRLEQSGYFLNEEIANISGQVREIALGKIILSAALFNPLDDESLKLREVIINDDTEVVLRDWQTEEIMARQKEFNEKLAELDRELRNETDENRIMEIQEAISRLDSPPPYQEQAGDTDDIKKNFYIEVEVDGDLRTKKQFTARRIYVDMSMAAMPEPMPEENPYPEADDAPIPPEEEGTGPEIFSVPEEFPINDLE